MNAPLHDVDDLAALSLGLSARLLNCLGTIDPNVFRLLTADPTQRTSSQEEGYLKVAYFRSISSRSFYEFLTQDSADLTLRVKALEVVVSHVEAATAKDQTALSSSVWVRPESLVDQAQELLHEMCALRAESTLEVSPDDQPHPLSLKGMVRTPLTPPADPGRSSRAPPR